MTYYILNVQDYNVVMVAIGIYRWSFQDIVIYLHDNDDKDDVYAGPNDILTSNSYIGYQDTIVIVLMAWWSFSNVNDDYIVEGFVTDGRIVVHSIIRRINGLRDVDISNYYNAIDKVDDGFVNANRVPKDN